ncbi:BON domain-containing protein [Nitrolancea hollandica]|uniref:BON domain-containing protein n=1 Tax=Nitrolancea hollandica Lb TaxID=1129897 RepID=I4EF86_9BACT|nr:BON domain-containing protein [Nitrolancea hollandica]CCF83348.1 hypothetical protein NITHO_2230004 [Nitrolancea hollandica Lb]
MVLAPPLGMGYGLGMGYAPFSPYASYPTYPTYPVTLATDQSIARMVVNSINTDPGIPSDADITVDVEGGIVTLTGNVPTKFAKHRAGDDAWWLPDVFDVHNRLQVVARRGRGQEGQQGQQRPQRQQPQRQPQGQSQAH